MYFMKQSDAEMHYKLAFTNTREFTLTRTINDVQEIQSLLQNSHIHADMYY